MALDAPPRRRALANSLAARLKVAPSREGARIETKGGVDLVQGEAVAPSREGARIETSIQRLQRANCGCRALARGRAD